jgi:hypothetical protein
LPKYLLLLAQVDALIAEQGLDITEDEYALLIGVCAAEGATWGAAARVLARMSRELTQLQPATLAAVERFFRWALICIRQSILWWLLSCAKQQPSGAAAKLWAYL